MAIKKVDSSMVWAVDYDAKAQTLEIAYKRKRSLRYHRSAAPGISPLNEIRFHRVLHSKLHCRGISRRAAGLKILAILCRHLSASCFEASERSFVSVISKYGLM